ncbi:MAG: ABC transporter ATP-binding protein [Desulfobacteria bacterium]
MITAIRRQSVLMRLDTDRRQDGASLIVKSVSMDFVGLKALDGVSLELHQGEILGVIGPNGSGKTTLINVITGLLKPSEGRIESEGINITGQPAHKIARVGIARTFQRVKLFRDLTVLENAEVGAVSMPGSRRKARRRALRALEELEVAQWTDRLAGSLPYGHERKVEIARALAMKPKFLLLDEPAAGLDEEESGLLLETLYPIPKKNNLGMFIVDHDMNLIMRLCDRLHVLNYGRTIGEGVPDHVRNIPEVIEAYLGS